MPTEEQFMRSLEVDFEFGRNLGYGSEHLPIEQKSPIGIRKKVEEKGESLGELVWDEELQDMKLIPKS